jgi:SAM-dependent methyltransferase
MGGTGTTGVKPKQMHEMNNRVNIPDFSTITEAPDTRASADQMQILHTRYALAAKYAQGKDVIEIACGAGVGLGMISRVARRLVGSDIDERNCAVARETYRNNPQIEVIHLDAEQKLPFPAGSFDLVVLFEALYYLHSADTFFQDAKRLLKPGGTLLIFSVNCRWGGFNPSPFSTRYYDASEMAAALMHNGFQVSMYGGFPEETRGLIRKTIRAIRKAAVALHVIPQTQRSKEWLKRIFYGELEQIPREIVAGTVAPAPLDALNPPYPADVYRFICAVAVAA